MSDERLLARWACELVAVVPVESVEATAAAILAHAESAWPAEIARRVPQPQQRERVFEFVRQWRTELAAVDARSVAVALWTAAAAESSRRHTQSAEPVWTGPDVDDAALRRTEQAVLQVLDSACSRITLVSYAVYRIPNVAAALVRAAERGVRLTVIVETPDRRDGAGEYDTVQALGEKVAERSRVYYWPRENRPVGDHGKVGLLHVKCAVSDGSRLFLSSANLTHQAFTINMELGLLLCGGDLPGRVESLFDHLIRNGRLRPV